MPRSARGRATSGRPSGAPVVVRTSDRWCDPSRSPPWSRSWSGSSPRPGPDMPVGIGLVGSGDHQLTPAEIEENGGRLVSAVGTGAEVGALLHDPRVELVSVCLAPRSEQVDAAVAALDAGRHVLI